MTLLEGELENWIPTFDLSWRVSFIYREVGDEQVTSLQVS